MKYADLDESITLSNSANRHVRKATWGAENPERRWRAYEYAELIARDKAGLDIFRLKDDSLGDSDNLPPPDVIAQDCRGFERGAGAVSVDRGAGEDGGCVSLGATPTTGVSP